MAHKRKDEDMEIQHKIWGERWDIREDCTHKTTFLKLKKGYKCSWHIHKAKSNLFVVLCGRVGIKTRRKSEHELNETVLTRGMSFVVEPDIWHAFQVYEDSGVIEEAYVKYEESDIIRYSSGGRI